MLCTKYINPELRQTENELFSLLGFHEHMLVFPYRVARRPFGSFFKDQAVPLFSLDCLILLR